MQTKKVYLCSLSPRRKELLSKLIGDNFVVMPSNYQETNFLSKQEIKKYRDKVRKTDLKLENIIVTTLKNTEGKALSAAKEISEGIIITADSLVSCQGKIMGKPRDLEEARVFLQTFSGKKIEAVSSFCVYDAQSKKFFLDYEATKVYMDDFSEQVIDYYVRSQEPLGKAGGFSIQGLGSILIKKIDGDFHNVVGLPLFRLNKSLVEFGVFLPRLNSYHKSH